MNDMRHASTQQPELSVVVPVFNEERNLVFLITFEMPCLTGKLTRGRRLCCLACPGYGPRPGVG